MLAVVVGLLCWHGILGLTIPLQSKKERCMVVYTQDQGEPLHLELTFRSFAGMGMTDYRIKLYNTETKQSQSYVSGAGVFREQISMQMNVIYRICIHLETDLNVRVLMEYEASSKHRSSYNLVKVPDSLLRSTDLVKTFELADRMEQTIFDQLQILQKRQEEDNEVFEQHTGIMEKMKTLALLEIVVLVALGVTQMFVIQFYLTKIGVM